MKPKIRSDKEWIQTFTRRKFWPLNPYPEDIDVRDIAHHTAILNRYTGATSRPYSIAEHSVRVSMLAEQLAAKLTPDDKPRIRLVAKCGLMHDASEAYLNDAASPIKRTKTFDEYRKVEKYLQGMINEVFGLGTYPPEVLKADMLMLVTEAHALLPGGPIEEWTAKYAEHIPAADTLGWDWSYAEGQFIARFSRLAGPL